jgi:hypothetical protein
MCQNQEREKGARAATITRSRGSGGALADYDKGRWFSELGGSQMDTTR